MEKNSIQYFLDELIEVFLHNLVFYIPIEIIREDVLDQIEDEIPDKFLDELSLLNIEKGICQITNEDAIEVNQLLLTKKDLLERNIFTLLEKSKQLSNLEFQIIIERYFDQLLFYLLITEWLSVNLKKFNKTNIKFPIIGTFKFQHEYLRTHLDDIYRYFETFIDIQREQDFSVENMLVEHIPDLISRYSKAVNKNDLKNQGEDKTEIISKESTKERLEPIKKSLPKKRQRPIISEEDIEEMILKSVFKVQMD